MLSAGSSQESKPHVLLHLSLYMYLSIYILTLTHMQTDVYYCVVPPPAVLRCVGLPGRSISNFNSAHDTENNRAIDRFISEDGEVINRGDSIWCTPSHTHTIQYNTVHVIVD